MTRYLNNITNLSLAINLRHNPKIYILMTLSLSTLMKKLNKRQHLLFTLTDYCDGIGINIIVYVESILEMKGKDGRIDLLTR